MSRTDQQAPAQASAALTVVGADRLLTAQDRALVVAAQALVMQDAHFKALKSPGLSRYEVNAGLQETAQGYLYLRYDVQDAVSQGLWVHWGKKDRVSWSSGQIAAKAEATDSAIQWQL